MRPNLIAPVSFVLLLTSAPAAADPCNPPIPAFNGKQLYICTNAYSVEVQGSNQDGRWTVQCFDVPDPCDGFPNWWWKDWVEIRFYDHFRCDDYGPPSCDTWFYFPPRDWCNWQTINYYCFGNP